MRRRHPDFWLDFGFFVALVCFLVVGSLTGCASPVPYVDEGRERLSAFNEWWSASD